MPTLGPVVAGFYPDVAVAVLGAVVTGDTNHDRVVAHTAARTPSGVALDLVEDLP